MKNQNQVKIKWVRNPVEEAEHKRYGFTADVEEVAMIRIDREKSLHLNARVGDKLTSDHVLEIALSMEAGTSIPLVVLYDPGNGKKMVVISGNHRTAAADYLEAATVTAYVLRGVDTGLMDDYTRECNTRLGLPEDRRQRLVNAIHFMEHRGLTMTEAAKKANLPLAWLRDQLVSEQTRARLKLKNLAADKLPDIALKRLHSICGTNEPNLMAAAEVMIRHSLKGEQIDQFLDDIKDSSNTESTFRAKCETLDKNFKKESERAAKIPYRHKPRQRFLMYVRQLTNISGRIRSVKQLQLLDEEMADVSAQIKGIADWWKGLGNADRANSGSDEGSGGRKTSRRR